MLNSKICYSSNVSSQIHCHKSTRPSSSNPVFNGNPIYPHTACIFLTFFLFFSSSRLIFLTFLSSQLLSQKAAITGICIISPHPTEIEGRWNVRLTRTLSIKEKEQRNKHWPGILYKSFSFLYNRGMRTGMLS